MLEATLTHSEYGAPASRSWSGEEGDVLRLWTTLWRCYATCAKVVSGQVQKYELTTPQFAVLEALYHLGPLALGELADKLLVTGGNVTYVVDRLESRGLVVRYRDNSDRRVVLARLTPEGGEMVGEIFPTHVSRMKETVSRHLDAEEQQELARLLKKLGRGLSKHDL